MLIDEVELKITGGTGGDGKSSFFAGRGGPSGGDGGRGGNVYVSVNMQLSDLNKYSSVSHIEGSSGIPGGSNRRLGANGEDLILQMPIGTTIIDLNTKEEFELNERDRKILIARGGEGGLGNDAFKTPTNRSPKKAEKGKKGQTRHVKIILRLIADYGLIGMPNAGKSTLLNELTAAQAKVANYSFTTLEPNLGVLDKKVLADIPGLIEGASTGRGLGIRFLKHIEKVQLLVHCISAESSDVVGDYKIVRDELMKYNPRLVEKDEIILLTKIDLIDEKEVRKKVGQLKKISKQVYPITILDPQSLATIKKILLG